MGRLFFGTVSMFKRLILSLALAAGLLSPAYSAGTIPFSLSQQLDTSGNPLAGCQFYTIQAGTTSTPQNAYQDSALTIPLPNPQTCDAAGRLPQMFLADGTIKVRLTDKNGVTQVVADNIAVVGASSGSGGGGTVDPTTILSTGDLKATYGTGSLSGFVRANGRTIGSATSGATERANADAQALFEYLWGADANLTVSGGRGASANADWVANKTIELPDLRGRTIAGMDTMGNSSADRLNPSVASGVLGSVAGAQNVMLAKANLPNYAPPFTGSATSVSGATTKSNIATFDTSVLAAAGGDRLIPATGTTLAVTASGIPNGTVGSINGGVTQTATATLPPLMVMTYYIKL